MINRIIDISVKHKTLLLVAVALACLAGWRCMMTLPLDATPDLSETQVILYSRWDRSPDIIEDQVTYPIVTSMVRAPKVKTVRGVAEVAPVGGYRRQYQVNVDPNRLQAYGIPIRRVAEAVREGNNEVGGRLLEFGGTEYMIRGRGYAQSLEDFQNIVLQASEGGTTIRIKDVGEVDEGPELRRGLADLDGQGEVVSGVVIMRNGENALEVIDRVKQKLREIEHTLPEGVKIVPVYDRSELIHRAISSVKTTIFEVVATVVLIVLVFLWHVP